MTSPLDLHSFAIEGGIWLALVRGLAVAACLSVLGALVFRLVVAPPALRRMDATTAAGHDRLWLRLLRASVAASLLGGGAWLILQSAEMTGTSRLGEILPVVPKVILHSRFGTILMVRLALLAAVPVVVGSSQCSWRLASATALAAAATVLQAAHGHAASMAGAPDWLAASAGLHLLAAGTWLGQLLPLWFLVRTAAAEPAADALRRFSPVGVICVVALAVTASAQGWYLVGGLAGFVGTPYGWVALLKLLLFLCLVGLAVANRFVFMPRLTATAEAMRPLVRSILIEALVGLLVILAAGILTNLPPGMHQQPI